MQASHRLGLLLVPAIAATTIAALSAPTWAAAPAPQSTHFNLVARPGHVKFLGQKKLPGGDYTASWRVSGETVTVAGPAGSSVLVARPGNDDALATIRPPASYRKHSLAALAAAYVRAGKSVVQDAMAVGYSRAQALRLAGRATMQPGYTPGQIIETPCISVTGDGTSAYGRSCDVQTMVQDNGGGNWIVGDEVTGSGNDSGNWPWQQLTSLTAYVNYGANNKIVKWTPNSTVTEGNCQTVNLGLSYAGISLSDTETICPDRMDPYGTNTSNKFGSQWSGCDSNKYVEGVNSVDVDNNPSDAAVSPGLTVGINWGLC